jgi:hypothetical protein
MELMTTISVIPFSPLISIQLSHFLFKLVIQSMVLVSITLQWASMESSWLLEIRGLHLEMGGIQWNCASWSLIHVLCLCSWLLVKVGDFRIVLTYSHALDHAYGLLFVSFCLESFITHSYLVLWFWIGFLRNFDVFLGFVRLKWLFFFLFFQHTSLHSFSNLKLILLPLTFLGLPLDILQ